MGDGATWACHLGCASVLTLYESMKVFGMAGWNVDIWARWDDDFGCPEGLFLHWKSCQGVFCEHSFPGAAVSALSRWVLLHWSWCRVPHLTQPDACFNMVPAPLLHVIAQLSSAPVGSRCLGVGETICCTSTLLNFSTLYPGWTKLWSCQACCKSHYPGPLCW